MSNQPLPENRQAVGAPPMSGKKVQRNFVSRHRVSALLLGVLLLLLLVVGSASSSSLIIPTISIVSVVTDDSVTIQTHNYPPNQVFQVRMNYFGTLGAGGPVVGTLNSGAGGSLSASYPIPDFLKGQRQIAIRLDSAQGYFSYNWFWNNTDGTGGQPVPPPDYTGIPTISIAAVARDTTVTITTHNFPPNQIFDVTQGLMGTQGINGIRVGEINSGSGGSQTVQFPIPAELRGQNQISIRAQTRHANPYFAFNWFWNNTAGDGTGGQPPPTPQPPPPGHTGIPVIKICTVARDQNVTFQANNFPPGTDFVVTMGPMHTAGLNGTAVGSFNSGAGGTFTQTFNIPNNLKGLSQISIRAQGSPYFSYNWFWNNTTTINHCG